jgi:type IV pilus assembly protein PilN
MIKINLLAEGKRPVVARKSKAPMVGGSGDLANYLLIAGIVLGLLITGGWWLWLNHRIAVKDREVGAAQHEVDELQQVIKEVEQYKVKKAELERKITVINDLKENQRGPVQIMDEISRALPELLWLTRMEVTNTNITLHGSAFNMSAVANFIDNLDKVEAFGEPLLQDATQRKGRGIRTEVYDFRLVFPYSFKKPQAAADATAAAPAAPAAPGAKR